MTSPNPILSTIIIIFTLQAILLSILLVLKRPRRQSNIFLALIVFFFALMSLNIAWINVLLSHDIFYVFRYFQLELIFGIGPALFFYTQSIADPEFQFSQKDWIHFLPVILEFIFYRTAFYRLGADGMYQSPVHPYTPIYLTEQWLGISSILIYSILSLRMLYLHQSRLKQHYSNLENRSLNWLKVPVIFYTVFWIGWNILTEIDRFVFGRSLRAYYFLPTFVGLAIVTYWIGFKGYVKSQTNDNTDISPANQASEKNPQDPILGKNITALMEDQKPYLDPDLNLSKLAELLDRNPKQVSAAINQNFSKNFYEYVNQYRIEAFKQRMLLPDQETFTLLGHAFECGFKFKSTFNHVFKKSTGKTPSEYVKQLKK